MHLLTTSITVLCCIIHTWDQSLKPYSRLLFLPRRPTSAHPSGAPSPCCRCWGTGWCRAFGCGRHIFWSLPSSAEIPVTAAPYRTDNHYPDGWNVSCRRLLFKLQNNAPERERGCDWGVSYRATSSNSQETSRKSRSLDPGRVWDLFGAVGQVTGGMSSLSLLSASSVGNLSRAFGETGPCSSLANVLLALKHTRELTSKRTSGTGALGSVT